MRPETIQSGKKRQFFLNVLASVMESRLRYRFFGPQNILKAAAIQPGQVVLELGCGTGFFTLPVARLLGETGSLVSLDILAESVALVSQKVQAAGLKNVRVVQGDAVQTGLDAASFDRVLLFGMIPAPMIPLPGLLLEIQRVLKPGGTLAVWPPVPGLLPQAILRSGLFVLLNECSGVHNFQRAGVE